MIGRPGSLPWLVHHDLRLSFLRMRAMFGRRGPLTIAAIVLVALAAIHLLVWPLAAWFVNARADAHSARYYYPLLACAALFVLPWLISQALMSSTRALYSRGDLDLLLASPVSARVVVAARALAVAIEAIASVGIFLFPIANMNALLGGAHWLAIYPAMLASGLIASAIGLTLTVLLFRLMGPRRTRFAAQIVATFIASAFVLGGQIVNVLPEHMRDSIMAAFDNPAPGGLFDPGGPLWLPVRAAMGDGGDLAIWCATAIVAFALVAIGLGPNFMASAVRSAGAAATSAPARSRRDRRFRAGVGVALRMKEWRLLARDPWLASQMLLQVIYTLPISVVIWRSQVGGGSPALAASPFIVVIASQISASLAWLAVSSEDAPEFIATAPVPRARRARQDRGGLRAPRAAAGGTTHRFSPDRAGGRRPDGVDRLRRGRIDRVAQSVAPDARQARPTHAPPFAIQDRRPHGAHDVALLGRRHGGDRAPQPRRDPAPVHCRGRAVVQPSARAARAEGECGLWRGLRPAPPWRRAAAFSKIGVPRLQSADP